MRLSATWLGALAIATTTACTSPHSPSAPVEREALGDRPIVVAPTSFPMPIVITDGPERVARLTEQIDALVSLTRLSDAELDEVDMIEDGLAAFEAGRATVTLETLEERFDVLERDVFDRVR